MLNYYFFISKDKLNKDTKIITANSNGTPSTNVQNWDYEFDVGNIPVYNIIKKKKMTIVLLYNIR